MQAVLVAVYVSGLVYLLFGRRRFDVHAIAYLAACLYFLPGLYGYTLYPAGFLSEQVPIADATYGIMILVMSSIGIGMVLADRLDYTSGPVVRLANARWTTPLLIGLMVVGFLLSVATTGQALLASEKSEMLTSLNRWHILWVGAAVLALVVAAEEKRKGFAIVAAAFLVADLFIGFRSSFSIAILALGVLVLSQQGAQRLFIARWRLVLAGFCFAFLIFTYKHLYIAVKLGRLDLIVDRIGDPAFYALVVGQSEPFTTQAILDAIVRHDFSVPADHFTALLYRLIFFAPELGAEPTTFNDLFQGRLFPTQVFGMANNIWAEMFSTGGWPLLCGFVVVFNMTLFVFSWLIRAADPRLRSVFAVLACYWAFYIHRNELAFQLDLEKRIVVIFLIALIGSNVLLIASRSRAGTQSCGMTNHCRRP